MQQRYKVQAGWIVLQIIPKVHMWCHTYFTLEYCNTHCPPTSACLLFFCIPIICLHTLTLKVLSFANVRTAISVIMSCHYIKWRVCFFIGSFFIFFTSSAMFSDHYICIGWQVIRSGIPNFCAVALALSDLGYVRKFFMLLLYPTVSLSYTQVWISIVMIVPSSLLYLSW